MGGAVSSGRDNNELVDNLMSGNYIRTRAVERVFRVLDRADYMSAEARDQAYKDLAWRNGPLHLSAPCIYSEVMEALELKPGLSFLNVGSGTGYLSTLVGLIIGSSGISHGVEALPVVFEYANKKLSQFTENSVTLDEYDFCFPKYYTGNGLCLAPTHLYDRVYCGAGVLSKHENYFKQLTKVGGVLVMPLADTLVQLRRVSATHWSKRNLLNVSFALLREPAPHEQHELIKLEEQCPASLQILSRASIRESMRAGLMRRHPELREPPAPPPPAPRTGPRRICIPYDEPSDEELNDLHDLDEAGGAHEMNALLSLVLSMGQNRAAGSLRLDPDEDVHIDDEYAEVGDLYSLDEGEDGSPPPRLMPGDGVIVFDVAPGGIQRRRRPRSPIQGDAAPAARTDESVDTSVNTSVDTSVNTSVNTSVDTSVNTSDSTAQPGTSTATQTQSDTDTASRAEHASDSATTEAFDSEIRRNSPNHRTYTATSANSKRCDPCTETTTCENGKTCADTKTCANETNADAETCANETNADTKMCVNETSADTKMCVNEKSVDTKVCENETNADTTSSANTEPSANGETSANTGPNANTERSPTSRTSRKSPRAFSRRAEWLPPALWIDSSSGDEDATQVKDSKRQKLDSGIGEGTASSGTSPDKSNSTPSKCEDDDTDMPWCVSDSGESVSPSSSSESASDGDSDSDHGGDEPNTKSGNENDQTELNGEKKRFPVRIELKRKKLDSGIGGEPSEETSVRDHANNKTTEGRRRVQKRGSRARRGCVGGGCRGLGGRGQGAAGAGAGGARGGRDGRRVQLSLAMKRGVRELPLPHALKKYVNYGRCYQF